MPSSKLGTTRRWKHSIHDYVRREVSTNGMESFWSMLKRSYIAVFHRISREHLPRDVTEFKGCHNTRDLATAEQMAAMARDAESPWLRYEDLIRLRLPPPCKGSPMRSSNALIIKPDGAESELTPPEHRGEVPAKIMVVQL